MGINFVIPEINIGGTEGTPTLQFYRRGFLLGTSGTPTWQDIVLSGNGALTLVNAKQNGLNYVKLFGGCEQDGTPTPTTPANIVCNNGTIKWDSVNQTTYVDGTTETVELTGLNLFDKTDTDHIGGWYVSNGELTIATINRTYVMRCKPNTTYYIKHCSVVGGCRLFYTEVEDWETGSPCSSMSGSANPSANTVSSITTSANAKWLFANYGRGTGTTATYEEQANDFILSSVELTASTPYEAYYNGGTATATDLLAVGDSKDVQSVLDGAVTKNIGIYIVKGTESWNTGNDVGTKGYLRFNMTIDENKAYGFDVLSNCFASKSSIVGVNESSALISGHGTSTSIFMSFPASLLSGDLTTITGRRDALNAWFSAQYNAGTPVIIMYPLATATTSSVTAQTLTTQAGTNIVQITQASISSLPLEASYKGKN